MRACVLCSRRRRRRRRWTRAVCARNENIVKGEEGREEKRREEQSRASTLYVYTHRVSRTHPSHVDAYSYCFARLPACTVPLLSLSLYYWFTFASLSFRFQHSFVSTWMKMPCDYIGPKNKEDKKKILLIYFYSPIQYCGGFFSFLLFKLSFFSNSLVDIIRHITL